MSLNKILLIGRVGGDPQVRDLGGNKVANFNLATSEKFKGKDGNVVESTEWHNVTVWGKLAETAEKYVAKGSLLYVEGRIKTEKYTDKEGNDRFLTRVVASSFQMLGGKSENSQPSQHVQYQNNYGSTPMPTDDDLPEGDGLPF